MTTTPRICMVTGASGGLGKALAQIFARQGDGVGQKHRAAVDRLAGHGRIRSGLAE